MIASLPLASPSLLVAGNPKAAFSAVEPFRLAASDGVIADGPVLVNASIKFSVRAVK